MVKSIIGIVGQTGSGKGMLAEILSNCVLPASVFHIRSSDILNETLNAWNLPHTRSNLQNLSIMMSKTFGLSALSDAVFARINRQSADIVIFDGVRWQSDVSMIR